MRLISLVFLVAFATPARAGEPDRWLDALTDRVIDDLAAGKPLVIQAHVPLCDRHIIACGNLKLGDGESPGDNLYWATTEGFVGWFGRRASGWQQALHATGAATGDADILDVRVWTRTVAAPAAWRSRGVPAKVPVFVVAFAWRGQAIDRALATYWSDLYGTDRRDVTLADGTVLPAAAPRRSSRTSATTGSTTWPRRTGRGSCATARPCAAPSRSRATPVRSWPPACPRRSASRSCTRTTS